MGNRTPRCTKRSVRRNKDRKWVQGEVRKLRLEIQERVMELLRRPQQPFTEAGHQMLREHIIREIRDMVFGAT